MLTAAGVVCGETIVLVTITGAEVKLVMDGGVLNGIIEAVDCCCADDGAVDARSTTITTPARASSRPLSL